MPTKHTNFVFKLPGAGDDHDLPVQRSLDGQGAPVICSNWVPTEDERQAIARGANLELIVWGSGHPPVAMRVEDV